MKICPFMSHMLGADGNVLEIDSTARGDVVVLGYDGDGAVGVKTETRPARAATKKARDKESTASHLYCLRDTCRFYRAADGECTFDSILDGITRQAEALSRVGPRNDGDDDRTTATVVRELDKFWKFQTKSVTELISSFGDSEKKQRESFTKLVSDVEKRIVVFMDEDDVREERLNAIRDGVNEIKDTIDARYDGYETLTATVSDLVLSFDDNLKEMKTQWQSLSSRISALEGVASKMDSMESKVSHTIDNLERLERHWAELMDVVRKTEKKGEDSDTQRRRREAMKFNNLGVTSFHNGDLKLARDQFLEAVNRDSSFAECYNNLGLVYTEIGDSDLAADAFTKAIKLNPDMHAAYNNLGYVFYKQGNYDRAVEMYNESLGRSSNNSSAHTNLGNAYFKLGRKDEARQAWEKALELDPTNETARRNLKNPGN